MINHHYHDTKMSLIKWKLIEMASGQVKCISNATQYTITFYDVEFFFMMVRSLFSRATIMSLSCPERRKKTENGFDVNFIAWKFVFIQSNEHKSTDNNETKNESQKARERTFNDVIE